MCTVSFIPVRDSFFFTSNRDEKLARKRAVTPIAYKHGENYLVFPKDAEAGGTWIVMKENGDCAVLLNGAFLPHVSRSPYQKSRGLVLLEVINDPRPSNCFVKFNLDNIEPFTLILFESGSLYEFRWDGQERYCKQLAPHRPYIWSSCTLYDGLIIKKRERWFATFLNRNPHPTQRDIMNFHRFTGDGDKANDLLMSRDNLYGTVSITSIHLTGDRGSMKYLDVQTNELTEKSIGLLKNSQEA
jgi:uncharacterized protein with NRDE domain